MRRIALAAWRQSVRNILIRYIERNTHVCMYVCIAAFCGTLADAHSRRHTHIHTHIHMSTSTSATLKSDYHKNLESAKIDKREAWNELNEPTCPNAVVQETATATAIATKLRKYNSQAFKGYLINSGQLLQAFYLWLSCASLARVWHVSCGKQTLKCMGVYVWLLILVVCQFGCKSLLQ